MFSGTVGRFLILEVETNGESFVLINFYIANTQPEQIKTREKLLSHIKLPKIGEHSQIVCAGDFDFFFKS